MKTWLLTALIALIASPVFAQEQPKFIPYTITEQQHQGLINYLAKGTYEFANPVISTLMQLEQQAQMIEAKKNEKPKDEKKEPKKP